MPLTPEEQMKIISDATAEGYKGKFTDLLQQAEQERAAQENPQQFQEEQKLKQIHTAFMFLMMDKMRYTSESRVPMSAKLMMDLSNKIAPVSKVK